MKLTMNTLKAQSIIFGSPAIFWTFFEKVNSQVDCKEGNSSSGAIISYF